MLGLIVIVGLLDFLRNLNFLVYNPHPKKKDYWQALVDQTKFSQENYVVYRPKTYLGKLPKSQALETLVADKQKGTHETD